MPFLFSIVIYLVVIGLILWLINMIPMDPIIKQIIRVVVIVVVCLWLLSFLTGYVPFSGVNYFPHRN